VIAHANREGSVWGCHCIGNGSALPCNGGGATRVADPVAQRQNGTREAWAARSLAVATQFSVAVPLMRAEQGVRCQVVFEMDGAEAGLCCPDPGGEHLQSFL